MCTVRYDLSAGAHHSQLNEFVCDSVDAKDDVVEAIKVGASKQVC